MANKMVEESIWDEFSRSIPDIARAREAMNAWADAWGIVLEIGHADTARAFHKAMRDRGISVPWPLRLGEAP